MSLVERKRALRRDMMARRQALPPVERARCSAAAAALLSGLPELGRAQVVAGYVASRGELDPAPALAAAQARGATVVLPRVDERAAPRLRFCRVAHPGELGPGAFGLLEPLAACPEVALEAIDLFVVPGAAFDRRGARLGLGRGYYDEVGAHLRAAGRGFRVGVGYDFQIVDDCPTEPHDVPVDCVVTDGGVFRAGGAA